MRAHAGLRAGIARRGDGVDAFEKREPVVSGSGIGSQRMGASGTSTSTAGAVRQRPISAFWNWPQWVTVGRMR